MCIQLLRMRIIRRDRPPPRHLRIYRQTGRIAPTVDRRCQSPPVVMRALGEDGVEGILSLGCWLIGGTFGSTRLNLLEGYPGVQSGTDGEVCHVGLGARVILPGVEWLVNFAKFIICAVCTNNGVLIQKYKK